MRREQITKANSEANACTIIGRKNIGESGEGGGRGKGAAMCPFFVANRKYLTYVFLFTPFWQYFGR